MLKNTRRQQDEGRARPYEWFVFAGADGRLMGHNTSLDGSLFRSGPGVATRDFVYDLLFGASIRIDALRISIKKIKRSEEFYTPLGGGGKQQFYSVNIGVEF
jgi:hypothetical protein